MTHYCYALSLDGIEQPPRSVEIDDQAAAIAQGRELLVAASVTVEPNAAYCVVYAGGDIDGEPLGVWDYSAASPVVAWTPAE